METTLSTPLEEPPGFLSLVSMVGDDERYTIQQLKNAERPAPELYGQARDLFVKILDGNFSFEFALSQARAIVDTVERRCAEEVLCASKHFLISQTPAPVRRLPRMWFNLPNGLKIPVSGVRLRQFDEPRLMALYFWKRPLSRWQLSADRKSVV